MSLMDVEASDIAEMTFGTYVQVGEFRGQGFMLVENEAGELHVDVWRL